MLPVKSVGQPLKLIETPTHVSAVKEANKTAYYEK